AKRKAEGIEELSKLAHGLAGDTRKVQSGLAETRRELVAAQAKAQVQDARMQDLEVQLARAREQVRTDALTGALNRRGFEE
ncbi:MAG TPA: GGDEF domain-containing protein, partial [Usitatibacteraceae bacterium]|nr:GGDEF domain-containing protein [Usitatibacteraceae bacterium]